MVIRDVIKINQTRLSAEEYKTCQVEANIRERLKRRGLRLHGWIIEQGFNLTTVATLTGVHRVTVAKWTNTGCISNEHLQILVAIGVPVALFSL